MINIKSARFGSLPKSHLFALGFTVNVYFFVALCVSCIFLSITTGCSRDKGYYTDPELTQIMSAKADKQGWMNGQDYKKLRDLTDELLRGHRKATEAEVIWALDLAKQAKKSKNTTSKLDNYFSISTVIQLAGNVSEPTRLNIYTFCRELIAYKCNETEPECDSGKAAYGAPKEAAIILGQIGDVRAVPMLTPLLQHPFRRTREEAANALQKLKERGVIVSEAPHPIINQVVLSFARKAIIK